MSSRPGIIRYNFKFNGKEDSKEVEEEVSDKAVFPSRDSSTAEEFIGKEERDGEWEEIVDVREPREGVCEGHDWPVEGGGAYDERLKCWGWTRQWGSRQCS